MLLLGLYYAVCCRVVMKINGVMVGLLCVFDLFAALHGLVLASVSGVCGGLQLPMIESIIVESTI